jgi:hypothetical protein
MANEPVEFPILKGYGSKVPERFKGIKSFPLSVIAPHEAQAKKNHYQTLKRLAERGGLSPSEAVAVLEDRQWRSMPDDEAWSRLMAIVASKQGGAHAEHP